MKGSVNRNANTLLAVAKAKGSAKVYLVAYVVLGNQILKLFYYLTGSLNVAGASNTYCNLHNFFPRIDLFLIFDL